MTNTLPAFEPRDPRLLLRAVVRAIALTGLAVAALLVSAWRGGWRPGPPPPPPAASAVARGDVVVLDGDTLLVRGRSTRLLGADAPECAAPWFEGDQQPWAGGARDVVQRALDEARAIEVVPGRLEAQDERGRDLAHVLVDGRALSALLVDAGLAVETVSRFGDDGLPELAAQVRAAAARRRGPLPFEQPWRWRRAHRRPEVATPR